MMMVVRLLLMLLVVLLLLLLLLVLRLLWMAIVLLSRRRAVRSIGDGRVRREQRGHLRGLARMTDGSQRRRDRRVLVRSWA